MDSFIYVVLPVFNRLASTKRFLSSMENQTYRAFEIVICDDGSTDETTQYIRSAYPNVKIIQGTGQLWWTAGINMCIRDVLDRCQNSDYILTINNDNTLPPDYLAQKIQRATEYPNTVIGSLCVYADDPNIIETSGAVVNYATCATHWLDRNGARRTTQHHGVRHVTNLPGKGTLVPVSIYKQIGLYDEVTLPQYHADTDFTMRAHEVGIRVIIDYDSIVFSEVNMQNMVLPNQSMTLKDIFKTFKGPYSMNNFKIYNSFAKKHFGNRRLIYLARQYTKTCAGLALRYLRSKLN